MDPNIVVMIDLPWGVGMIYMLGAPVEEERWCCAECRRRELLRLN